MNLTSFLIDIAMMAGMGATIFFCMRLYRQLDVFAKAREEMGQMMADFDKAAAKADAAVRGLSANSSEMGKRLQGRIDEAQALLDELGFITASGEGIADRLELLTGEAREVVPQHIVLPIEDLAQTEAQAEIINEPNTEEKPVMLDVLAKSEIKQEKQIKPANTPQPTAAESAVLEELKQQLGLQTTPDDALEAAWEEDHIAPDQAATPNTTLNATPKAAPKATRENIIPQKSAPGFAGRKQGENPISRAEKDLMDALGKL